MCIQVKARYRYPSERSEILIVPSFHENHIPYNSHRELASKLEKIGEKEGIIFAKIRDIYPTYEFEDLAKHPAAVIIPYQVSFMSFFELYKMAIPLFVPTPELLTEWHFRSNILYERTWNGVHGHGPRAKSSIPRHTCADKLNVLVEDPNNEVDKESVKKWIRYADFYEMPFITQFNSFNELVYMLKNSIDDQNAAIKRSFSIDFKQISENMTRYSKLEYKRVLEEWGSIIKGTVEKRRCREMKYKIDSVVEKKEDKWDIDYTNIALKRHYDIVLNNSCLGSLGTDVSDKKGC